MGINYKMQGRAELTRRLERLVPGVTEAAAKAKLEVAQEAAAKIAARAPRRTGKYAASIKGERQADNPNVKPVVGHRASEDPDATGIYADFIWRFLEFGTKPHSTLRGGGSNAGKRRAASSGTGLHQGSRKFPHIYPTWRSMKPKAKRKIANAINKYIREDIRKK